MGNAVVGAVIPVGPGREENLRAVLRCVEAQIVRPDYLVIVCDGNEPPADLREEFSDAFWLITPSHRPGHEQPRNLGVRALTSRVEDTNRARRRHDLSVLPSPTHVWFLDSDLIVQPDCLKQIVDALAEGPADRVMCAPYDWLSPGQRPTPGSDLPLEYQVMRSDPRWPSFDAYPASEIRRNDLSAGLACFSGNILWPINEFRRIGGFWAELNHGRCEDGEIGARAVAMDVGISFAPRARGWHQWHEINLSWVHQANTRDVPMINARHPWIEGSDVFVVDRDGKAFDVRCPGCHLMIPTGAWWQHAEGCGVPPGIPTPWLPR